MGVSLNIPVTNGKLNLGMWQGIYLNEHRKDCHERTVVLTLQGREFERHKERASRVDGFSGAVKKGN